LFSSKPQQFDYRVRAYARLALEAVPAIPAAIARWELTLALRRVGKYSTTEANNQQCYNTEGDS
jgi:hypothetical protein